MNAQSPIVSEFATTEEQAAYADWLARKVAASLADDRPAFPHDEAIGGARGIIERNRQRGPA